VGSRRHCRLLLLVCDMVGEATGCVGAGGGGGEPTGGGGAAKESEEPSDAAKSF